MVVPPRESPGSGRVPISGREITIAPTRAARSSTDSTSNGSTQRAKTSVPIRSAVPASGSSTVDHRYASTSRALSPSAVPPPTRAAGQPGRSRSSEAPIGARVSITAKSSSTTTAPT
ncbi:hypothetical protein GA0074692_5912 [Micromonospora pallida]|uniref:Uncharacterized protein n=1 Tax=Micromonospora pallida TaxID=145854 RepID=A0A1C6TFZ6_9ACTN|nr:hypothetical protein GA0074692_5912 [Micromonospora pallida]